MNNRLQNWNCLGFCAGQWMGAYLMNIFGILEAARGGIEEEKSWGKTMKISVGEGPFSNC